MKYEINKIESISNNNGYEGQVVATKGRLNKRVDSALLTSFDVAPDGTFETGYLNVVETSPRYRGKGIGIAVVNAAIELAKTHRASSVELDSVDTATAFYEKLGFVPDDDNPNKMRKIL